MARNRVDQDEQIKRKFDSRQMRRVLGYVHPYRWKMSGILLLVLAASAATMLIPKFFQMEMDTFIPQKDMNSIFLYSGFCFVIAVFAALVTRVKITVMNQIGQDIIHQIRQDIFEHLQELPFSFYDNAPHGKIQVRVVNYVNNLSDLLSNGIVNTLSELCNLIFIIAFMFYMSPRLTLICLCGLPVLLTYVVLLKRKQYTSWQIQSNKQSNLNAYIAEGITGIRVTQAFAREQRNMAEFNRLSMEYRRAWLRACYYQFLMSPMVDLISTITTAFVYVVGVSCIAGGDGGVTVGVMVAFTAYISRFWAPVNTLAGVYNNVLTAVSYLERIFETIDEEVEVKDVPGAVEMPKIRGEVEFSHVNFCYEDGVEVLHDVNFTVKPGQSVAFVGPTGAGKTTIVNLLSRFYNVSGGEVLIDGQDISGETIHSLRRQMGVMMQDSFIFSGTIMDNIRYGNKTATDEEVIEAAKTVCAHDFIKNMEKGYETQVNERGNRLSVGQRQLISFARALLNDPAILILDEATSSIDTETEIALQKGLGRLLKGRTSFLIAHRLSTIRNSDCIMYVDHGKIMEAGTHDELLAKKGLYYQLYMSQYAQR